MNSRRACFVAGVPRPGSTRWKMAGWHQAGRAPRDQYLAATTLAKGNPLAWRSRRSHHDLPKAVVPPVCDRINTPHRSTNDTYPTRERRTVSDIRIFADHRPFLLVGDTGFEPTSSCPNVAPPRTARTPSRSSLASRNMVSTVGDGRSSMAMSWQPGGDVLPRRVGQDRADHRADLLGVGLREAGQRVAQDVHRWALPHNR